MLWLLTPPSWLLMSCFVCLFFIAPPIFWIIRYILWVKKHLHRTFKAWLWRQHLDFSLSGWSKLHWIFGHAATLDYRKVFECSTKDPPCQRFFFKENMLFDEANCLWKTNYTGNALKSTFFDFQLTLLEHLCELFSSLIHWWAQFSCWSSK